MSELGLGVPECQPGSASLPHSALLSGMLFFCRNYPLVWHVHWESEVIYFQLRSSGKKRQFVHFSLTEKLGEDSDRRSQGQMPTPEPIIPGAKGEAECHCLQFSSRKAWCFCKRKGDRTLNNESYACYYKLHHSYSLPGSLPCSELT